VTARAAVVLGLLCVSACGESPSGPGPINPPPPPPPVNAPPVIESITTSVSRTEVDTEVTVTAAVRDTETPVSQLAFAWSADGGTFNGAGASVTWRVAKGATTPVEYAIKREHAGSRARFPSGADDAVDAIPGRLRELVRVGIILR
jgi:hypothetical protein